MTSLPGATRVDEVPTPAPPADADAPPARASDNRRRRRRRARGPRRRGGGGASSTASRRRRRSRRGTRSRPLLAAAPLAYHLLPEHVAAELVADVVACVAALASVFLESAEGAAFEAACRDAFDDAFRAASCPRAEAGRRRDDARDPGVRGVRLEESRALMDAGEAVALDALDLLATPEARDAVRGARSALGALAVVLDTPRCKQAVAGAVEDICENLRAHRDGDDDRRPPRRPARVPSTRLAEGAVVLRRVRPRDPGREPRDGRTRGLLARHRRRAVAARPRSLCRLVAAGCFLVAVLALSGVGAAFLSRASDPRRPRSRHHRPLRPPPAPSRVLSSVVVLRATRMERRRGTRPRPEERRRGRGGFVVPPPPPGTCRVDIAALGPGRARRDGG